MATLSDPGRYAVASLFALMMRDDFDREFREETMRHLLQHLNLAKVYCFDFFSKIELCLTDNK